MNLYKIIKQLQETSGTNDKLTILKQNKDNALLKEYMRYVTCPSINFYVTEKTFPYIEPNTEHDTLEFNLEVIKGVECLSKRELTGDIAKRWIVTVGEGMSEYNIELFKMLLLKDIRAKIGVTLVNKVWPKLCVSVPYQRCSLPDEKNLLKFKEGDNFVVQLKGDGMFASLVVKNSVHNQFSLHTRNGNKFPKHLAQHLLAQSGDGIAPCFDIVFEGELLCYRDGVVLPRKDGNGILNSVMQGGEIPEGVVVKHMVWNALPLQDWGNGKTTQTYEQCFNNMVGHVEDMSNAFIVPHAFVNALEQAYSINQKWLTQGYEGSIIKTLSHKWKDGTSKECLKLKIEAEIDLVVTGCVEGNGKASGMLGALSLSSSCGKVSVDCGSGFTDTQRKEMWEQREQLIGKVVTIKANDLLSNSKDNSMALFLPIFIEIRNDKTEADSLERIEQIFYAIKSGQHFYE